MQCTDRAKVICGSVGYDNQTSGRGQENRAHEGRMPIRREPVPPPAATTDSGRPAFSSFSWHASYLEPLGFPIIFGTVALWFLLVIIFLYHQQLRAHTLPFLTRPCLLSSFPPSATELRRRPRCAPAIVRESLLRLLAAPLAAPAAPFVPPMLKPSS